ncbi:3-phosphoglycerate dehydrogenase [Gordonia desulfuricans]|uniref:3-phosphoglycerate dehydrogenase n=1 Tax=Gordonia desulfuricans TaxID=89051 RepID=A0A7K3LLZ8_9ACTN|nr:NAD(P)-dependent oxidoreductase [Gordonia desulfuricans]NDK89071.1 3-phosphoglycerate dehydrogenase [Gordonia desulfuricans]
MGLRVLLLPPNPSPALLDAVEPDGVDVEVTRLPEHTSDALRAALPHCDVIVGDWSGQLRLDETEAALAERAVLVQQPTAGVETIDLDAWARRGVPVANIGPANSWSVTEWCLGATMNLLRSYRWADAQVRGGRWPQLGILDEARPRELRGSRVGVVGAGQIGTRLCAMYANLGCAVSYWSPRSRIDGASWMPLPNLLSDSEIVIVAIARTPDTLGLIGQDAVDSLPEDSILIDVSRGGIVDQNAVLKRVRARTMTGAALDVFGTEPPQLAPAVLGEENVLLSPHVAGVTRNSVAAQIGAVRDNILAVATGEPLLHVLNR